MQFVLIIHEVADYPAWKKIFDQAAALRKGAGEIAYQVLKYENDPNRIVHFSRWSFLKAARELFLEQGVENVTTRKIAGRLAVNN